MFFFPGLEHITSCFVFRSRTVAFPCVSGSDFFFFFSFPFLFSWRESKTIWRLRKLLLVLQLSSILSEVEYSQALPHPCIDSAFKMATFPSRAPSRYKKMTENKGGVDFHLSNSKRWNSFGLFVWFLFCMFITEVFYLLFPESGVVKNWRWNSLVLFPLSPLSTSYLPFLKTILN